MENLDKSMRNLSADQRAALLELVRKNKDKAKKQQLNICRRKEETNHFPLSFSQNRLWFIDQLHPESIMYNFPFAYRIKGSLDINLLEKSLNEIIKRHEVLRTVFQVIDEEPKQVVVPELNVKIEKDDLSGLPQYEQEQQALEIARKHAALIFNLNENPLIRFKLITLSENEAILITTVHHIVFDSWSMNVFLKELSSIYNGYCNGTGLKLPELTVQYADYTESLLRWFQGGVEEGQLDYWKKKLGDELSVVEFPADKQRPQMLTSNGDLVNFELSSEATKKLRQLALTHQSTLNMVFLAAFKYLIYRYTRQSKVLVGSPAANRKTLETEELIGLFVNTLVLCTDINENMTFAELLQEVKHTVLGAFENQDIPFERLVEAYQLERDTSRSALVQIMYNYMNVPKSSLLLEGTEVTDYPLGGRTSIVEVRLQIEEDDDVIRGFIEYNRDLYNRDTIERIVGQYKEILNDILLNADKQIKSIPVIIENEKQLIFHQFNNTCAEYPREKTVVQLFEEQVERTPDHVAVVYENEQLTYKELNAKANALAAKLRGLGVGPDDFVAIIAERSIEMIAGIYGIIKAGGAYVPIDPGYPKDRIEYMLHDCRPKAILVYHAQIKTEIPVIDLENKTVWEGVPEKLERVNKPGDLLYVIYTSGTTGRPKGVMNIHSGLINRILWMQNRYQLDETDVILQKTTFTFDVSVWEILWWSFIGAKVVMLKQGGEKEPESICEAIIKNNVTTMHFVPSMLSVFLAYIKDRKYLVESIKHLKYIFASGEALKTSHLEMFNELIRSKSNTTRLINFYGPTEASIDVTYFDCEYDYTLLPIGKPISNTQIYILNGLNLCGIGIPGELCIAGDGVAKGYLNKLELTAEKFIQNPYEEGKMYRTGDLARWLPDGNIEYLGRIDEQVKIRGFRIELGEIESVIRKIETVNDTAVMVREDKSGEKAIYAYIVSDEKISIPDIKDTLKKDLPEYMVPSYMMQIEKIPVTTNGKLDRRALPEIEAKSEKEYIAPRNKEETIIANIFAEVLGVVKVGIKDDFFELGGHSLRATRVINRIESETGIRIPLNTIFKDATVEGLAKVVQNTSAKEYNPIPKAEKKEGYPISPVLERIYYFSQDEGVNISHNLPRAIEVEGEINKEKLTHAIQKLLDRHEILRTSFHFENGRPIQRIHSKVEAEIEEMNINCTDEEERILRLREFVRPFDLSQAPLLRVGIAKEEQNSVLLFDMHHIISDGMSMGIFVNELNALYNGEELKPLRIQYKDCSEWMRTRDISAQKQYWENEFRERVPEMNLPYDYKQPQTKNIKGSDMDAAFSREIKEKVRTICAKTGTTEYMVLLAGYMIMLNKYSGQEDVVVGSPVSGRTHRDMENMLGMFSNILAMRARPKAEKTFLHFLKEIKEISLKAYEYQDYPFDELVRFSLMRKSQESPLDKPEATIGAKIDMPRNPLFDVMFILQNNEKAEINFSGKKARYISVGGYSSSVVHIILHIADDEEGYKVWVEYCPDLFKRESIGRMVEALGKIIEEAYENTNIKIGEIGIVKVNANMESKRKSIKK